MASPPRDIRETILLYFFWARQVILAKHPDLNLVTFPEGETKESWVSQYLIWAAQNGVLHVFANPEPKILVLVRRLKPNKISYYRDQYIQRICEYDHNGEIAYVDFCYGPGYYPIIIQFLKSLGTELIGWTHAATGKTYIVKKMHEFTIRPLVRAPTSHCHSG